MQLELNCQGGQTRHREGTLNICWTAGRQICRCKEWLELNAVCPGTSHSPNSSSEYLQMKTRRGMRKGKQAHQYHGTERFKKKSHWRKVLRWCQANTVEVKQGDWKGRQKKAEISGSETSQCLRCFSVLPESAKRRWWRGSSGLYHEICFAGLHWREHKLIYENKNKREIKWGGKKGQNIDSVNFGSSHIRMCEELYSWLHTGCWIPLKDFFSATWHNIIQAGQNEVTRSK